MYIQLLNTGISCSLQISTIYFLNTGIFSQIHTKKPNINKKGEETRLYI